MEVLLLKRGQRVLNRQSHSLLHFKYLFISVSVYVFKYLCFIPGVDKRGPLPAFVDEALLENSMVIQLPIVYGCFHTTGQNLVAATEAL